MRSEEYKKKIVEYLKKNLKKGYTIESLRWALIGQGYPRTIVENSINEANKELSQQAPILKEKPVIIHEILDENDQPIQLKRPWWKRFFGL